MARKIPLKYRPGYNIIFNLSTAVAIAGLWIYWFGNPLRPYWPHVLDLWGLWYFLKYGLLYILWKLTAK